MANQYNPVIILDTTNADLDLATLVLGSARANCRIRRIIQVNPTAADKFFLRDVNSNIIFEMYAKTTGQDEVREFNTPILSNGLKMLTADITRTTGVVIIYLG